MIDHSGKITHFDNWTLEMFGGLLPAVGDYFATLWPTDDPEANEFYQVSARYYVGEFRGDNCWWFLLRPALVNTEHERLLTLSRAQSAVGRRMQAKHNEQTWDSLSGLVRRRRGDGPTGAPSSSNPRSRTKRSNTE